MLKNAIAQGTPTGPIETLVTAARDNLTSLRRKEEALEARKTEIFRQKRTFEQVDAASSSSKRTSSSGNSRPGQKKFVARLKERDDGKFVVEKIQTAEAAHIVPYSLFKNHEPLWLKDFQQFCHSAEDGVDDVRNGLLLSPTLHKQFDEYLFTIECKRRKYHIKAGVHKDVQHLDGRELHFGGDRNLWPHPKFLAYHNAKFEIVNKLRASGHRIDRQDSDITHVDWIPRDDGVDSDLKVRSWIDGIIPEPLSDEL
ncbi:hypothetical protein EDD86DRAFT_200391 [Gorgonomyces haynaldii]|nr:hypothetical protein EDD86DRAFT_200391 [Gorgonomyces haynaldii]